MTQDEYNEAAALVVRLRKDLELHTDALRKSNAQCAEYLRQNEMLAADRATLHRELVEVRAALASVTEQRDSLQRTLQEWEEAETKPHVRVAADDIADHVVPPVLPDELEFRSVVPTPEMLTVRHWWDVQNTADWICFKNKDQRPVVWRSLRGDAAWKYEDCPQPLKPHGMTWQQMDKVLADRNAAAAVLPMCTTCHGCGSVLEDAGAELLCPCPDCDLYGTKDNLSE